MPDETDWDREFNPDKYIETPVRGQPGINPAINDILQLLDVGDVSIKRMPAKAHDGMGGLVEVPSLQAIAVEIVRRSDGTVFSAAAVLRNDAPPAAFIVTLAHILAAGVKRVKHG